MFCYLRFPSGLAAHLHLSWLDPHKERRFTVVGSKKMATFDDMELERKLTVYDKGFDEELVLLRRVHRALGRHLHARACRTTSRCGRVRALRRVRARRRRAALGRRGRAARGAGARGAAAVARRELACRRGSERRALDRRRARCVGRTTSRHGRRRAWSASRRVLAAARPSASQARRRRRRVIGDGVVVGAGASCSRARRSATAASSATRRTCASATRSARAASSAAAASVENDVRIGARVRIADERLHHGVVDASRTTCSWRPACSRPTTRHAGRRQPGERARAARRCGARAGSAAGAVLLPGVEVGEEAFVAAGAVVTRDVPAARRGDGRAGAGRARGRRRGAARSVAPSGARRRLARGRPQHARARRVVAGGLAGGGRGWRARARVAARLGAAAGRGRQPAAAAEEAVAETAQVARVGYREAPDARERDVQPAHARSWRRSSSRAGSRYGLRDRGSVGPFRRPARGAAAHPPLRARHRARVRVGRRRRSSRATRRSSRRWPCPSASAWG